MLIKKMLINEELLIVVGRQMNFDRDQKATVIYQTTCRGQPIDQDRLFGHISHRVT
jgi:hypothetical protein